MSQHSDIARLSVEEDLTIYNAAQLKHTLVSALSGCQELELDLSQVGEIDTSGLQLLLLAKREAQRQDKQLRLVAHSAAVREVLDLCNVVSHFGDPMLIPAKEAA